MFHLFRRNLLRAFPEWKGKKHRKTNCWNNSTRCTAVVYSVYRLKSLRKRFEGTRCRGLWQTSPSNCALLILPVTRLLLANIYRFSAMANNRLEPRFSTSFSAVYTFFLHRGATSSAAHWSWDSNIGKIT